MIELCFMPPPSPLLLHHHPLPHARPLFPLHLLPPLRILMLGTVTTPSLVHILKIVHQSFVSLCHLVELLGVPPTIWEQLFNKGKVGRLDLSSTCCGRETKLCIICTGVE